MPPAESKDCCFDRTVRELFGVKPTMIPLPTPAKIIDSCACCGEKPGANRIRLAGGKSCASTAMRVMIGFGCER